jgi:hypothetical protein
VIDGIADDSTWSHAAEYTTVDSIANIPITFKIAYTGTDIFVLASYPDENESITHKSWLWDQEQGLYVSGPDREDALVLKWNMGPEPIDLSVTGDDAYAADIWFWKASRTNPLGYADDKIDRSGPEEDRKAQKITTRTGRHMFLKRKPDSGETMYKDTIYVDYEKDVMPHFDLQQPNGSAADIKAKGVWADGRWTIEMGRALNTGHDDDVQFESGKNYYFGISRYEISGGKADPEIDQPLFNAGEISELMTLQFGPALTVTPEAALTEPDSTQPVQNE